MPTPPSDSDLLALLVHRGLLTPDRGRELAQRVVAGENLDDALAGEPDWDAERVRWARRTRGGERPDLPGFEVGEPLGRGGTARVFRARDVRHERVLALKVLEPAARAHPPTLAAFVREGKLLAQLEHEHLVRGFGVARYRDTVFSKLEVVDGETLQERLDRDGGLREDQALAVVLQAAEALRYLESKGLVHRDVKPGNVMLRRDGRAVLIDLGFAVESGGGVGTAEDGAAAVAGTAAYLAPEQAQGLAADVRSDVYSLGVTLFQLVVGKLPFEASDDRDLLARQIFASLESPELKSRGASPYLQYFVQRMMAKDAADRYAGFDELIADVRAQLEGRDAFDLNAGAPRRRPRRGGR